MINSVYMTESLFVPETEQPDMLAVQMQDALDRLHLIENHSVIIGGAVLQLHGLRQTYDIDILISQNFHDFIEVHNVFGREKRGYEKWSHGFYKPLDVDRLPFDPQYNSRSKTRLRLKGYLTTGFTDQKFPLTFEEALDNVDPTRGLPTLSLEKVKQWKQAIGRQKDLADIALIETVE